MALFYLTLNSDIPVNPFYYDSTIDIVFKVQDRGLDIRAIFPSEVGKENSPTLYYPISSVIKGTRGLFLERTNDKIDNDSVIWIYGLDEHRPALNPNLFGGLQQYHESGMRMMNTPVAEYWAASKKNILKLDSIPIPRTYSLSSEEELIGLLKDEKRLVAKADSSFGGHNIHLIEHNSIGSESYNAVASNIEGYIIQEYVPNDNETRLIYLDGKLIASRQIINRETPWEKRSADYDPSSASRKKRVIPYTPTRKELYTANSIIEQTGMEYGSIDFFVGDKVVVNEINGSGTGTEPYKGLIITDMLLDHVIRKYL
ncbi:MAG: ATP-grasp domain-containing protein [Candidatus Woesearchaeota archaeon]